MRNFSVNSREDERLNHTAMAVAAKALHLILFLPALTLFVFFSFFDRGGKLLSSLGVSASQVVLVSLMVCLFVNFATKGNRLKKVNLRYALAFVMYIFFVVLIVSRYANSDHLPLVVQYHMELFFCLLMSLLGFVIASERVVSINAFSFIVVGAGVVYFGYSLAETTASFRGHRFDFSESRNYFASAMAIVAIFCFIHLFQMNSFKSYFLGVFFLGGLGISLLAIFMSGTRSAFFSIVIVASIIFLTRLKNIFYSTVVVGIIAVFVSMILLRFGDFFSVGGSRMDGDLIIAAFQERARLWSSALAVDSLKDSIFGRPFLYDAFGADNLQPHNIMISSFRFSGILISVIFLIFVVMALLISISALTSSNRTNRELAIAGGAFFAVLIYASFSGNLTRIWHFYLCLGIVLGLSGDRSRKLIRRGGLP